MAEKEALFELKDVTKSFGGLRVADQLSLHVDEGETLVLSRKIRKQPICGMQGAVTFFFNTVTIVLAVGARLAARRNGVGNLHCLTRYLKTACRLSSGDVIS